MAAQPLRLCSRSLSATGWETHSAHRRPASQHNGAGQPDTLELIPIPIFPPLATSTERRGQRHSRATIRATVEVVMLATSVEMAMPSLGRRWRWQRPRRANPLKVNTTVSFFFPASNKMRFVGLVLLCTLGAVQSLCSNNYYGIESDGICCVESCGECGGRGCNSLPGGRTNCCTSTIEASNVLCSVSAVAPCIVDNASLCDVDEIPGIQGDGVCCSGRCGTCGGPGCSSRSGGEDGCCRSAIIRSGVQCGDSGSAPCISTVDSMCEVDEIAGVQGDGVCCSSSCGVCGGVGCDGRPGGRDECCRATILAAGVLCGTSGSAPCISTAEGMCETDAIAGVQGNGVCCSSSCGTCGGAGCSGRPGGEDECCRNIIIRNGVTCEDSGSAPCISTPETFCNDGTAGIQGDGVCCSSQCGTCGGASCSSRPGGATECCRSTILRIGTACGTAGSAPCITTVST